MQHRRRLAVQRCDPCASRPASQCQSFKFQHGLPPLLDPSDTLRPLGCSRSTSLCGNSITCEDGCLQVCIGCGAAHHSPLSPKADRGKFAEGLIHHSCKAPLGNLGCGFKVQCLNGPLTDSNSQNGETAAQREKPSPRTELAHPSTGGHEGDFKVRLFILPSH